MSSSSSPFDASASALGYLYQCRYALLLALQKGDDPNQCLSIEKLDDVAFHESPSSPTVAKECLQFKHKINRVGGLGDSSPDIWKTLKIWAEGVKQKRFDLDRVSLFLVTTASAGNRNSVRLLRHDPSSRKPLEALQNLESAAAKSTNPIVQDALARFLTLTSDDRRKLFLAIYLLDNAPSVVDLDQQFTAIVRYAALPQHRDAFLQRIEGWWLQRIVMHLSDQSPGVISVVEVQQQFHEIREQFRRDSLPDDMFSAQLPPEATPDADDRVFVRQLRLINLSLARLRNAQEDHYRAFVQRSQWVKEHLMALDEAEKYELRLIDGWKERFAIMRERVLQGSDEPTLARHGSDLYDWMSTEAAARSDLWVRADFKSGYMTRGSYHMLAELIRLGWHPEYETRLAPPPTATTGSATKAKTTKERKKSKA